MTADSTADEKEGRSSIVGIVVGAVIGLVVGILMGMGVLSIPGIGTLQIMGPYYSALVGLGLGAGAGALFGAAGTDGRRPTTNNGFDHEGTK